MGQRLPTLLAAALLAAATTRAGDPEAEGGRPAVDAEAWWGSIDRADLLPPETPVEEAIDHYVDARLAAAGVTPALPADDATVVRRMTLDLAGRIPTAAEARDYVESGDPSKRRELADRLLGSASRVRHEADEFDRLLSSKRGELRGYLTLAFGDRRPWDRIFRELIEARGQEEATRGADALLREGVRDHDRLANDISVAFLGVNISCARCHDHPHVPAWTQELYYGMKSFFIRSFENGGLVGERDYGQVSFKTTSGESRDARPRFLGGPPIDEPETKEPSGAEKKAEKELLEKLRNEKRPPPEPEFSRRAAFVDLVLEDGKAYLARSIVNRLWNRFLGYGLVMPLDQMHSRNPPSHPRLLEWLARDLASHDYDLDRLIRGIVLSEAYARTSLWSEPERPAPALFAVARVRPLTARQLGVSLRLAASAPGRLAGAEGDELERRLEDLEKSGRSLAAWFDDPEGAFQVSVDEALLLSNSERVRSELLDGGDSLVRHLLEAPDPDAAIRDAFWNVVSRAPESEEVETLRAYLDARDDRREEGWRQVVWSLLTASEFRFNH